MKKLTAVFIIGLMFPFAVLAVDVYPLTPNDTKFSAQWSHKSTEANYAWTLSTGSKNVIVAVIDTKGVDINHEDLKDNIWTNSDEVAGNGRDDDANGFIDDVHGWDFIGNDNNPGGDRDSHGTLVAGIIGGAGNNGKGVTGVNWNVSIMTVRSDSYDQMLKSLRYVIDNGAQIVNISKGFTMGNANAGSKIKALIQEGTQKGVLFVTSAGNNNLDSGAGFQNQQLPCHIAETICVGATLSRNDTEAETKHPDSNFGADVDVWAPGSPVWSTRVNNQYGHVNGATSMSSPYIAGTAALLKAYKPNLTVAELRQLILENTDGIQAENLTLNRVNVYKAMQKASGVTILPPPPLPPINPLPPVFDADFQKQYSTVPGQAVSFTIHAEDPLGSMVTYSMTSEHPEATLNAQTGAFGWTPAQGTTGFHRFTFTATDSLTPPLSTSVSVDFFVIHGDPVPPPPPPPQEPPKAHAMPSIIDPQSPLTFFEGVLSKVTITGKDDDSKTASWKISGLPKNCSYYFRPKIIAKKTSVDILCSPTLSQAGTYPITVDLQDDEGAGMAGPLSLQIQERSNKTNTAPQFEPYEMLTARKGQEFTFDVAVKDPDSDDVTLSMPGSSLYAKNFDAKSGRVMMIFPYANRLYFMAFRATDGKGNATYLRFPVWVTE